MAQGVTEVFRAVVPSVGLVLKARGDIRGKQEAYGKRIREYLDFYIPSQASEYGSRYQNVRIVVSYRYQMVP